MAEFRPNRPPSAVAAQVIADKPSFWEHRLTSVLLKDWVAPIQNEWVALVSGRYADPQTSIELAQAVGWLINRSQFLAAQTSDLSRLVNDDLRLAWGDPGVAGDAHRIVEVVSAIADCCERVLIWEESVRFNALPLPLQHFRFMMIGVAGPIISTVMSLPEWLDRLVQTSGKGMKPVEVVMAPPAGWDECFQHQIALFSDRLG